MGQIRTLRRDLPMVLAELHRRGARNITRRPAQFDGTVRVAWMEPEDAPINPSNLPGDLLPLLSAPVLVALSAAFIVVLFAVVSAFGGIGPPG